MTDIKNNQPSKRNGLVIMDKKKKQKKAVSTVIQPPGKPHHMEIDEIKNLEEPIYMPPNHKPRGRPRNLNFLSYADAREFVRGEMIPSRNKFHEWWDRNKPKAIPRFPYRVYKDWVSWNDFLGTDNNFGVRVGKSWRSLEEAALWVHKLKIESYTKWMAYCKANTLPEDIPARPDLVYAGWKTWNHWLGNRPVEALEAIKEAQKTQLYYIIHEPGTPENVLIFGADTVGPSNFKERWEREKFNIVKLFWYEKEYDNEIKNIVTSLSSPYLGEERQRICPNVWEIIWYLSLQLRVVTKL